MRILFAFTCLLFISPAIAADWGNYANTRYGYEIGVPPGFSGGGESDSGDGQVFRSKDGSQTLTVWGGYLLDEEFSADMQQRKQGDADQGWAMSYEASSPQWISYSGSRGGHVLYARGIARCGDQYAMFRLEYAQQDVVKLNPVVEKLVQTLKAGRC